MDLVVSRIDKGQLPLAGELTQSRDRFAAGVGSNVEVIQAQEAVTLAAEQFISALYGFNIAKALLARSVGSSPEDIERFLAGR